MQNTILSKFIELCFSNVNNPRLCSSIEQNWIALFESNVEYETNILKKQN